MTPVLPALDPIPLPAPVWLLWALLLFTFVLHVVPMTVTLGGGFWAIVTARRAGDPAFAEVAYRLGKGLPYWTAATVTTGVSALLFLQVLYGPTFYAASVALAWPWLAIVGIVLASYYGYYFRAYRHARSPRAAFRVGAAAWVGFAAVAFVFATQMTLMLDPARVAAVYLADRSGATLATGVPFLWSRYLHLVAGAIAVGALWLAWLGASSRPVLRFAASGFAAAAAVQVALGTWALVALPAATRRLFLGGAAWPTVLVVVAVALTILAIGLALRAARRERPTALVVAAAATTSLVLVAMVLVRDVVRRGVLGAAARLDEMAVAPQWGVIVLFGILLVAGVAAVGWMVAAARAPAASSVHGK
ncbi:MAG TPA: hypothetical protein VD838_13780 [Anaeromyxobacteraceae bacterium]|nr:hypothetical protein [Anaeromyxobacteraceae bacterium]